MTVSIFGAKSYEIYELSSSTKAAQTKGATQLEKVSEFITFNNEKFEEFEVDRKQKENEIAELKEDLAFLKEKFIEVVKNGIQAGIVILYMEWMKSITKIQIKRSLAL